MQEVIPGVEEAPKKKRQAKPLCTFRVYEREQIAKGEKLIPVNHAVVRYANDVGLPGDFMRMAWYKFKDKYTEDDPEKKYRDWPTVFMKSVKENWFKLWYFDSENYKLTSKGLEFQVRMKKMIGREKKQVGHQ